MKYLELGYILLSRKHFDASIHLKHVTSKQHLKERFGEEEAFISLTTDIWTTESTITVHYIDNSWVLQAFVLGPYLRYTGINIAEKLKRVVQEWEIIDTVRMIFHDQGSNMKAAMEILHDGKACTVLFIIFSSVY